jgi:hypothetical protein
MKQIDSAPKCEVVETLGQAWKFCSYEWGIEDNIVINSSQGPLALCWVGRVAEGQSRGEQRYKMVIKEEISDLRDLPGF